MGVARTLTRRPYPFSINGKLRKPKRSTLVILDALDTCPYNHRGEKTRIPGEM